MAICPGAVSDPQGHWLCIPASMIRFADGDIPYAPRTRKEVKSMVNEIVRAIKGTGMETAGPSFAPLYWRF